MYTIYQGADGMEYIVCDNTVIVRIEKGEEILNTINNLCKKLDIKAGSVSGIGATNNVTMGLYNMDKKEYFKNTFKGDFEITSLTGNISTKDNNPYIHLHINIANEKCETFGGHLNECFISVTCEIFIHILSCKLERYVDKNTGLNLIL